MAVSGRTWASEPTDEEALAALKQLLAPRLADAECTVALTAEDTKRKARRRLAQR